MGQVLYLAVVNVELANETFDVKAWRQPREEARAPRCRPPTSCTFNGYAINCQDSRDSRIQAGCARLKRTLMTSSLANAIRR